MQKKLSQVEKGEVVPLVSVAACGGTAERLSALGIRAGARVKVLGHSLFRSGVLLEVDDGTRVAIGAALAEKITVNG